MNLLSLHCYLTLLFNFYLNLKIRRINQIIFDTQLTGPSVSNGVAYGIPAALCGIGIILSVLIVILGRYSKATVHLVDSENIISDKNIQLKKL